MPITAVDRAQEIATTIRQVRITLLNRLRNSLAPEIAQHLKPEAKGVPFIYFADEAPQIEAFKKLFNCLYHAEYAFYNAIILLDETNYKAFKSIISDLDSFSFDLKQLDSIYAYLRNKLREFNFSNLKMDAQLGLGFATQLYKTLAMLNDATPELQEIIALNYDLLKPVFERVNQILEENQLEEQVEKLDVVANSTYMIALGSELLTFSSQKEAEIPLTNTFKQLSLLIKTLSQAQKEKLPLEEKFKALDLISQLLNKLNNNPLLSSITFKSLAEAKAVENLLQWVESIRDEDLVFSEESLKFYLNWTREHLSSFILSVEQIELRNYLTPGLLTDDLQEAFAALNTSLSERIANSPYQSVDNDLSCANFSTARQQAILTEQQEIARRIRIIEVQHHESQLFFGILAQYRNMRFSAVSMAHKQLLRRYYPSVQLTLAHYDTEIDEQLVTFFNSSEGEDDSVFGLFTAMPRYLLSFLYATEIDSVLNLEDKINKDFEKQVKSLQLKLKIRELAKLRITDNPSVQSETVATQPPTDQNDDEQFVDCEMPIDEHAYLKVEETAVALSIEDPEEEEDVFLDCDHPQVEVNLRALINGVSIDYRIPDTSEALTPVNPVKLRTLQGNIAWLKELKLSARVHKTCATMARILENLPQVTKEDKEINTQLQKTMGILIELEALLLQIESIDGNYIKNTLRIYKATALLLSLAVHLNDLSQETRVLLKPVYTELLEYVKLNLKYKEDAQADLMPEFPKIYSYGIGSLLTRTTPITQDGGETELLNPAGSAFSIKPSVMQSDEDEEPKLEVTAACSPGEVIKNEFKKLSILDSDALENKGKTVIQTDDVIHDETFESSLLNTVKKLRFALQINVRLYLKDSINEKLAIRNESGQPYDPIDNEEEPPVPDLKRILNSLHYLERTLELWRDRDTKSGIAALINLHKAFHGLTQVYKALNSLNQATPGMVGLLLHNKGIVETLYAQGREYYENNVQKYMTDSTEESSILNQVGAFVGLIANFFKSEDPLNLPSETVVTLLTDLPDFINTIRLRLFEGQKSSEDKLVVITPDKINSLIKTLDGMRRRKLPANPIILTQALSGITEIFQNLGTESDKLTIDGIKRYDQWLRDYYGYFMNILRQIELENPLKPGLFTAGIITEIDRFNTQMNNKIEVSYKGKVNPLPLSAEVMKNAPQVEFPEPTETSSYDLTTLFSLFQEVKLSSYVNSFRKEILPKLKENLSPHASCYFDENETIQVIHADDPRLIKTRKALENNLFNLEVILKNIEELDENSGILAQSHRFIDLASCCLQIRENIAALPTDLQAKYKTILQKLWGINQIADYIARGDVQEAIKLIRDFKNYWLQTENNAMNTSEVEIVNIFDLMIRLTNLGISKVYEVSPYLDRAHQQLEQHFPEVQEFVDLDPKLSPQELEVKKKALIFKFETNFGINPGTGRHYLEFAQQAMAVSGQISNLGEKTYKIASKQFKELKEFAYINLIYPLSVQEDHLGLKPGTLLEPMLYQLDEMLFGLALELNLHHTVGIEILEEKIYLDFLIKEVTQEIEILKDSTDVDDKFYIKILRDKLCYFETLKNESLLENESKFKQKNRLDIIATRKIMDCVTKGEFHNPELAKEYEAALFKGYNKAKSRLLIAEDPDNELESLVMKLITEHYHEIKYLDDAIHSYEKNTASHVLPKVKTFVFNSENAIKDRVKFVVDHFDQFHNNSNEKLVKRSLLAMIRESLRRWKRDIAYLKNKGVNLIADYKSATFQHRTKHDHYLRQIEHRKNTILLQAKKTLSEDLYFEYVLFLNQTTQAQKPDILDARDRLFAISNYENYLVATLIDYKLIFSCKKLLDAVPQSQCNADQRETLIHYSQYLRTETIDVAERISTLQKLSMGNNSLLNDLPAPYGSALKKQFRELLVHYRQEKSQLSNLALPTDKRAYNQKLRLFKRPKTEENNKFPPFEPQ